ncbi:MAG: FtsX-like permease family protein [Actinomycetota bacterium]|nr:FtsX-like permease family protein [Actinomycetota bacterium]
MGRLTLRSVWRQRRRLLSTALAIVLGVGFMSGTLILAGTVSSAADDLFGSTLDGVDLVVTNPEPVSSLRDRDPLPVEEVDLFAATDGIAAAAGHLQIYGTYGTNRVLNRWGGTINTDFGSATVFESWIDDEELTPYRIDVGRAPVRPKEIALNVDAVDRGQLAVGEEVTVLDQFGPETFTLVGTFRIGSATSEGGGVTAAFALEEMQRLAGLDGLVDVVRVDVASGESVGDVLEQLQADRPDLEVRTGAEAADELAQGRSGDLTFFSMVLVVFGWVALLVGTFVIANTFTILVAQRTRELALLRALGASRGQVFGSVLGEAFALGVVSSAIGLAVGIGVARLINQLLDALGGALPTDQLAVRSGTAALAFGVGIGATMLAALLPAMRATRVPPIAAFREQEVDESAGSRWRAVVGVAGVLVGGLLASSAWRSQGDPRALPRVGLGGVLVVVALVLGGPFVIGRLLLLSRSFVALLSRINGQMAIDNAVRSPRRTSATSAAVMIGVALVVFVMAFASSARESITADTARGFEGDFIVTSGGGLTLPNGMISTPIPQSVVASVAEVPGVGRAAAMGYERGEITLPDGSSTVESVTSIDVAGIGPILVPAMDEGDAGDLRDDGILVDRVVARRYGLGLGDLVSYNTGGRRALTLEVVGISDDPNVLGYFTVTRRAYSSITEQPRDVQVAGTFESGADPGATMAAIRSALTATPNVWAFTRDEFVEDLQEQVGGFVTLIYGLLLLSVVISVLGISNTLSLTVHERTRELGLLRSIGMDRSGVRAMVHWEAVVIGLLGTIVGVVVGMAIGSTLVEALRDFGLVVFALPVSGLVAIAVGGLVIGGLSAVRPARRASRMSIIDALGSDH